MMDSFEFNKIAGAVLGTLVFVMGANFLSDLIFDSGSPEVPGYVIEVAESSDAQPADAAPEVPIATLLAGADLAKGEKVAKKCAACHTFDKGGANKVGPHLWNIVDRKAAEVADFKYSAAMAEFGQDHSWTFDELNGYLTSPKAHVPGTAMGFAGLKKDQDRADILAYLRSLSDSPVPLPSE